MPIAEEMLAEFEAQAPITRTFLERLPKDRLAWKPHSKSMTAGQLAYHLAVVPGGVVRGAQSESISPPNFQFPQPESLSQVLEAFEDSVVTVRRVMPGFDDRAMAATWRIMDGDRELLAIPRREFLRNVMLNHWYQHRGQFGVYLRLLDVAVPASFGPTADEPAGFGRESGSS